MQASPKSPNIATQNKYNTQANQFAQDKANSTQSQTTTSQTPKPTVQPSISSSTSTQKPTNWFLKRAMEINQAKFNSDITPPTKQKSSSTIQPTIQQNDSSTNSKQALSPQTTQATETSKMSTPFYKSPTNSQSPNVNPTSGKNGQQKNDIPKQIEQESIISPLSKPANSPIHNEDYQQQKGKFATLANQPTLPVHISSPKAKTPTPMKPKTSFVQKKKYKQSLCKIMICEPTNRIQFILFHLVNALLYLRLQYLIRITKFKSSIMELIYQIHYLISRMSNCTKRNISTYR